MNNENPLVRDSVKGTLDEMINLLSFLIKTLPPQVDQDDDEAEHQKHFTRAEIAGLCFNLRSLQQATESCFTQSGNSGD